MRLDRSRRGTALFHVLVLAALVAVGAAAFERAFRAWHLGAVRGADRARARALLESAWEETRGRLERAEPLQAVRVLPEGRVTLRREPAPAGSPASGRLVLGAWIRRHAGGEELGRVLVLDVVLEGQPPAGRRLRVLARQELGD